MGGKKWPIHRFAAHFCNQVEIGRNAESAELAEKKPHCTEWPLTWISSAMGDGRV